MRTPTRSSSKSISTSRTPSKRPQQSPTPTSRQRNDIPIDPALLEEQEEDDLEDAEGELVDDELGYITYGVDERYPQPYSHSHLQSNHNGPSSYPASSSSSVPYPPHPMPSQTPRIGVFSSQNSIMTPGNASPSSSRAKPVRSSTLTPQPHGSTSTSKPRIPFKGNGKGKGRSTNPPIQSNTNPNSGLIDANGNTSHEEDIPDPHRYDNGRLKPREKYCGICAGTALLNPKGMKERMVSCYDCGRSGHPTCLQMYGSLSRTVMNYPWECQDCKRCQTCYTKGDDARLMFCDGCDRGYHSFCLKPPLAEPPKGAWYCNRCAAEKTSLPSSSRSLPNISNPSSFKGKSKLKETSSFAGPISTPIARARKQKTQSMILDDENNIYDEIIPTSSSRIKVKVPKRKEPDKFNSTPNSNINSIKKDKRRKRARDDLLDEEAEEEEGTPMIVRLRLPSNTKVNQKQSQEPTSDPIEIEPEEEKIPYGGILQGDQADTSRTAINAKDKEDFEKSRKLAENRLGGPPPNNTNGNSNWDNSPAPSPSLNGHGSGRGGSPIQTPSRATPISKLNGGSSSTSANLLNSSSRPLRDRLLQQSLLNESPSSGFPFPPVHPSTPQQSHHGHHHTNNSATGQLEKINKIRFGQFDIDTWYSAPYPEEYVHVPDGRLWLCEFCLKYMKSGFVAGRHRLKCKVRHPPGDEIYRDGSVSVFEVDGRKNKIYCQNLCLLAKMFLDHKTLYYDVEPFLFYVMTEVDDLGARFVGYFSKEKRSMDNNVSCIMALPVRQRKGWGQLLIDFSYLLSKKEGRVGSPEKPLSGLGAVTYKAYWRLSVFRYLLTASPSVSMDEISLATSITLEDILSVLRAEDMITEFDSIASNQTPNSFKTPKSRNRSRGNGTNRRNASSQDTSNHADEKITIPKEYEIIVDKDYISAVLKKHDSKGYLVLKPDRLKYHPFLVTRNANLSNEERTEATLDIIGQDGGSATGPIINGSNSHTEEAQPATEEEINTGQDQATLDLVAELAASPVRSLRRKREPSNRSSVSVSPIKRNVRSRNYNDHLTTVSPSTRRREGGLRGYSTLPNSNSVNGRRNGDGSVSSLNSPIKKPSSLAGDSWSSSRRKRIILSSDSEGEEQVEKIEIDKPVVADDKSNGDAANSGQTTGLQDVSQAGHRVQNQTEMEQTEPNIVVNEKTKIKGDVDELEAQGEEAELLRNMAMDVDALGDEEDAEGEDEDAEGEIDDEFVG